MLVLAGGCAGGFLAAEKIAEKGLIGLAAGAAAGIIVCIILSRYAAYSLKAAQIAMMAKGVTEFTAGKPTISMVG